MDGEKLSLPRRVGRGKLVGLFIAAPAVVAMLVAAALEWGPLGGLTLFVSLFLFVQWEEDWSGRPCIGVLEHPRAKLYVAVVLLVLAGYSFQGFEGPAWQNRGFIHICHFYPVYHDRPLSLLLALLPSFPYFAGWPVSIIWHSRKLGGK